MDESWQSFDADAVSLQSLTPATNDAFDLNYFSWLDGKGPVFCNDLLEFSMETSVALMYP